MLKNKKTILVVDDDFDFSNQLTVSLKEMGFEILHADNVDDARALIQKHQPDGVSLDMQLKSSLGAELVPDILNGDFYPIVVSGYVTSSIRKILEEHRILYYDKTDPRFHPSIVAKAFSFLNFSVTIENQKKDSHSLELSGELPNGHALESIIRQKLLIYKFDVKKKAYDRLVRGIFYTLMPSENQDHSLASIYVDVLNIDYRSAFVSIKRLLDACAKCHPEIFYQAYHQKTKEEVSQLGLKLVPTPAEFIYHMVSEIRDDFN